MSKENVIQMAREAGMRLDKHNGGFVDASEIMRFAAAIRAATKDEDAKICEALFDLDDDSCDEAEKCVAAIRASK